MNNKNLDEFINGIKNKKSNTETEEYIKKSLTPDQTKKLNDVLSDKSALQRLLSTPQAKELLRKFGKDEK